MPSAHLVKRLILPALLLLCGCATAQKGAMLRAHAKIEQGQYDNALGKLSDAERYTAPTPQLEAEISFLRGRCYEGLGRMPEAMGCYRYLVTNFPDSIFAYQAREKIAQLEKSLNQTPEPAEKVPPAAPAARQF